MKTFWNSNWPKSHSTPASSIVKKAWLNVFVANFMHEHLVSVAVAEIVIVWMWHVGRIDAERFRRDLHKANSLVTDFAGFSLINVVFQADGRFTFLKFTVCPADTLNPSPHPKDGLLQQ